MTFAERSREIAVGFLQTVVIIDDMARFSALSGSDLGVQNPTVHDEGPTPASTAPPSFNEHDLKLTAPSREQIEAAEDADPDSDDLDAKSVIGRFAELGLVCAVLKPTPGESARLAQTLALSKTDIVVLDWSLHGDYGETALGVISSLLNGDQERLRLIAIYTGQRDLRQIVERVATAVDLTLINYTIDRPNAFTVRKGPVRIVVYAKPKAPIRNEDTEAFHRVTAWDALPDKLVTDFAEMTAGLISHMAVASFSALRKNTHRVLRNLSQPLDAAYLWHRATQTEPLDAEEHLRSIVVEEVAAVLNDEGVDAAVNIGAIEDWLAVNLAENDYKERFGLVADVTRSDAVKLLTFGTSAKTAESEAAKATFRTIGKEPHRKTEGLRCFADSAQDNTAANEQFAALLSIRRHYSFPAPVLTIGTLLRRRTGDSIDYWVCVQPLCDSVRLTAATSFPLLPLVVDSNEFHVVVTQGTAPTLRLKLNAKPFRLRMMEFVPNYRGVIAAVEDAGAWLFEASDGAQYEWLAELKPHHALRMVDMLSNSLRRVGLVESEWLRLWSKL